jgi:hypothetical protein
MNIGMTRPLNPAALAATLLALSGAAALGDDLTIVHEGTGSGTLGGTPFGSSSFVITSIADTNNRVSLGFGWYIDHTTSKIAISGVGEVDVLSQTRTFVNNSGNIVGYSRGGGGGLDLFNGPVNPAFGAWDMSTEIGPIVGNGSLLQWQSGDINTSGGVLIFNNGGSQTTFTASFDQGCYPDCDTSTGVGVLDIFDFLCFQNRFSAGSPYACDCDTSTGSGVCDIFDFLCFQNAFDAGCP